MRRSSHVIVSLALLSGTLLGRPATAADPAPADPTHGILPGLLGLHLGRGVVADQIILFPVFAGTAAEAVDVRPPELVVFTEPEANAGKQTVRVANCPVLPWSRHF